MSVKFAKEIATTAAVRGLKDVKEDTLQKIGEAVTGGKGQTGYLAVWLPFAHKTSASFSNGP